MAHRPPTDRAAGPAGRCWHYSIVEVRGDQGRSLRFCRSQRYRPLCSPAALQVLAAVLATLLHLEAATPDPRREPGCYTSMLAVLAVTALGINCTELIRPRDPSPIRSPQNIHSWLSERFAGLEIVEIGTRNGDGMACFAQTARAAIAVEIDRHYCEILRKRAARLAQRGSGNFTVVCQDYRKAHLDGDIFTWWEQAPFLTNQAAIQHLRREVHAGRVRPSAQAVVLFDMSWQEDVDSLKQLISQAPRCRRTLALILTAP